MCAAVTVTIFESRQMKDGRVDVSEESRPTVFEVLCDQCDAELNFDELHEGTRREILLALGAH